MAIRAKRFEPSSLDAFLNHFRSAFPTAKMLPLGEYGDVFLGARYRKIAPTGELRVKVDNR